MGIDAYALLRLNDESRSLEELVEIDDFFKSEGHAIVDLGARYREVEANPRRYAVALAETWRAVLLHHDDARGVLVLHDAGDLSGDSYDAIVARWPNALWLPNLAQEMSDAEKITKRLVPKDVPLLPLRGAKNLRFANLPPARAMTELSLTKAPVAVAQYTFDIDDSPSAVVLAYEPEMKRLRLGTKTESLSDGTMAQVIGRASATSAYVNATRPKKTSPATAVTITWIVK